MKHFPDISRHALIKRLDWYIIKKFLTTYFFLIVIVISIAVIFDFNERIDKLIACPATWQQICFEFYLNWIPYFANLFSPLFVFISVIFFTSNLAVLARKLTSTTFKAAAAAAFQPEYFFRKRPKISPVTAAVSVNPGKYAPVGKIKEPSRSPKAPQTAAQTGPYRAPHTATARKPSPIFITGVLIARTLVKSTSSAMSRPDIAVFLISDDFNAVSLFGRPAQACSFIFFFQHL